MQGRGEHLSHEYGIQSCPLCLQKLTGCEPILSTLYYEMRAIEKEVHISWGWRGKNDQEKFFNEGKSKVHWPNSKHNVMVNGVQKSQAIDIFFLSAQGKARFYSDWCGIIWDYLAPSWKDSIRWGGDFKDYLHFELKTVKNINKNLSLDQTKSMED